MEDNGKITGRALKLRRQLYSSPSWKTESKNRIISQEETTDFNLYQLIMFNEDECIESDKQATDPVAENGIRNGETLVQESTMGSEEPSTILQGHNNMGMSPEAKNKETLIINKLQSSSSDERNSIQNVEVQAPTRYISDYSERLVKTQKGISETFITANAARNNFVKKNSRTLVGHTIFDCKTKRSWMPNLYPQTGYDERNSNLQRNAVMPTKQDQTETGKMNL